MKNSYDCPCDNCLENTGECCCEKWEEWATPDYLKERKNNEHD
jgi:hypothetical protein